MGFKVGIPVLKLVRGDGNGRRSGNYRKVLQEMGNERYSRSKTLDRTRSVENVYTGFKSGGKCADAMDEIADAYRVKVTRKDGTTAFRSLRSDAVIGYAWILKPPAEVVNEWDAETWERFKSDSFGILSETCPELFGERNLMMTAEHHDEEGLHLQGAGMPWTADGRLSAKECINLKTFRKLNSEYPKRMQELGWDVEELTAYDVEKAADDDEYKADFLGEKKAKKSRHGQSVNDYAAQQNETRALAALEQAEAAEKKAIDAIKTAQQAEDKAAEIAAEAQLVQDSANDAIDAALARVEALRAERQREERTRSATVEELDSLIDKRQKVLDGMDEEIRRHRARKKVEGQAEYDKMLEQAETDSEALRRQKVAEGEREAQRIVNEAHRRSQELLDDIDETLRDAKLLPTAPTEESNFIVDWVKEHAPKVYAAAKKAFDAFIKQRENLRKRTQKLMGNAERYTQQMEDDGYSLR